ncbi:hypothetical protein BGZ47_005886 [Haplosporangium gracile]|nr:hypothetical protein BGZ47_005886 [Haplosporangium gracile]
MSIMTTISSAPVVEANNNSKPKPPKCKTVCNREYDPKCAKIGRGKYRTFGNQCMYKAYVCEHPNEKVKIISNTACPEKVIATPPPTCAKACIDIYDPVCAKFEDGRTKTFGNQCEMDNAMCGRPKEKVDVTKDECPKS